MPKSALIICNGEPPPGALARRLSRDADVIIAADGGANIARACGLRPDVIIGDLDSITPSTRRLFSSSLILHLTRQDNTDLEKALDFLTARRIAQAVIIGATGKRLDFTLGNLSVIWKHTSRVDLRLIGKDFTAIPVGRSKKIAGRIGTTVSLIPFGKCSGITLRNLQYPLVNGTMNAGAIGISNVVVKSPFTVEVRRGNMLMILTDTTRGTH
jgi:thiamine pyrophosphokinase